MCNNKPTKERGDVTPCTGRGGLVDGPQPCGGCGSTGQPPRPQEGEGRETGSPQGQGLLPAGTGQDQGDPPAWVWRKLWVGVLPGSGRYVGPPCVRQGRLWALPAPGTAAVSCLPQRCPMAVGGHREPQWRVAHPKEWVSCQLVPTCHQHQLCWCLESCLRCLLPACTRGPWLGMNVAKQGGSAPVRSRCSEQHTGPCALSWGGPGRQQGTRSKRGAGGHGAGMCPASWAWRSRDCGTAHSRAGWGGVRRHGRAQLRAAGVFSPQAVTPLSPGWEAGGLQTPPHTSTGCAKALGRETPSRRQQMSPSGAPSELGAGQEINSGVSSCPDWREQGNPPALPDLPLAQGRGQLRLPRDYCFSQKSPFFFRDG